MKVEIGALRLDGEGNEPFSQAPSKVVSDSIMSCVVMILLVMKVKNTFVFISPNFIQRWSSKRG